MMSKVKDTNPNSDTFPDSTDQWIHMLSEHSDDLVNEHRAECIQ